MLLRFVLVSVPLISVSLVDEAPRELLIAEASALTVDVILSVERLCVTAACESIQIDDQFNSGMDPAPVVHILPQHVPGCDQRRSLSFHMSQDLRNLDTVVFSMMRGGALA